MKAMRFTPKGYGGQRRDTDQVKRDGWHEQGSPTASASS
jgi:hypothetical protein